jgi:hypothetical protein
VAVDGAGDVYVVDRSGFGLVVKLAAGWRAGSPRWS